MAIAVEDKNSHSKKQARKTQSNSEPSSLSTLSRIPPHSLECEQALLACCIFEGGQESISACVQAKIQASSFYKPAHQTIFQVFLELYQEGIPIDDIILCDRLKVKGQ